MTNDFDLANIRKHLDALRAKHGADTAIGHRCSNLIEQLKNLDGADAGTARAPGEIHQQFRRGIVEAFQWRHAACRGSG